MLKSLKFDEMLTNWERRLLNDQSIYIQLIKDDDEIKKTKLDLKYQRVIKNDCERTRVKDRSTIHNFIEDLEKLLTFYCKKNEIQYKQGMNEIMGPFLILKNMLNLSLSRIYNLYSAFIFRLLTNYYHEEEFYSLQSSLGMLKLLIKYHEPQISNCLDHGMITPAMYATSWILTIFANKTKLDLIFHMWNILIQENDELFIHYFIVGFLRKNKEIIINCDYSQIPILISTLNINSIDEISTIYDIALKIRDLTPHSFRILCNNLCIFKRAEIDQLKFYFDFYRPDKLLVLPLLHSEVIYILYNNTFECPYDKCEKFIKKLEKLTLLDESNLIYHKRTFINDFYCFHCKRKKNNEENLSISTKSYVLLDLRIDEKDNNGLLPGTVIFDKDDFSDPNFSEKLTQRFSFEKEKCHFVLITSETNDFFRFEDKFYKEIFDSSSKKDTIPTRISKIICENEMNKIKGFETEKKLKEYDLFKKITKQFIKKNFPYVSFIFGGFKEIHNLKVPLVSHNSNCSICKKVSKRNSDRRKNSYLNENQMEQLFKKNNDLRKSMIITSSKNEDFTLFKTETNHLILDPHSNIYTLIKTNYSLDNVLDLFNNNSIKVFQCYQLDYKNQVLDCKEESNQILIFVSKDDIEVLRMDLNNNFDSSYYILVEKIFIKNILTINRKKEKNIIKITFISYLNDSMTMLIEFANDVESKQFIKLIQTYIYS